MPKKLKVVKKQRKTSDTTDLSLNVESLSEYEMITEWDRERVVESLKKEANIGEKLANKIADTIEDKLLKLEVKKVTTDFIRSLIDEELLIRGEKKKLLKQKSLSIPTYDLEQSLFSKTNENSNVQANNPEAVNMFIAESVLKQYALNRVFSQEVSNAHLEGEVHIHDLGYITRTYCSSHSLEYIKKYGLNLINLSTKSAPPKHALTLTGHLNTFLASIQAYYAGALGLGFLNIFYAPLLIGMGIKELKQQAQYLIFSCSQNAFSRGGQTLFIDFNIHLGIPTTLRNVPAIVREGKYCNEIIIEDDHFNEYCKDEKGYRRVMRDEESFRRDCWILTPERRELTHEEILKYYELFPLSYTPTETMADLIRQKKYRVKLLTYDDFEVQARAFALALMKVWHEGDFNGSIFPFPKFDLHINQECYDNQIQRDALMYACEMAADKGIPYFFFDRSETQLAQCCRLRETVNDMSMLEMPEKLRFTGFQNVTINLPQCAYRAKGDLKKTIEEIKYCMDIAMKAHEQKRKFIQALMEDEHRPMWQVGKISLDGERYVNLDKATYIIGVIGLNECVKKIIGSQLHESDEAYKMGIQIISHMYSYTKNLAKEYEMKVVLEESPAESAAARLAKIDVVKYEEAKDYVKGNQENGDIYYSNSVHFAAEADIDILERIEKQGKFHQLIEAGAITHVFLGEQRPTKEAIFNLIEKTWSNTQTAQLTISPELIVCHDCGRITRGFSSEDEEE